MNNDKNTRLIGIDTMYGADADGVFRKHTQNIDQKLIDSLARQRHETAGKREGEFMHVASIPTIIVEKWMREGFNVMSGEHSAAEIVKRLKQENLEAFLATEKRV